MEINVIISMLEKSNFNRTLGQLLAGLRANNDITQAEVARRMGINTRYIQRVEAGEKAITVYWMYKYMHALGLRTHINTLADAEKYPSSTEVQQAAAKLIELFEKIKGK